MNIRTKGFTLIELLVVIAIISLLSSVVLASLKDSRDKAQQAAYRQYLNEIVKAIELYKTDGGDLATLQVFTNYFDTLPKFHFLEGGVMASYIKWQEPPVFVQNDNPSDGPLGIAGKDYVTDYTCSDSPIDEYVILFMSLKSNLKFNKYKQNGTHFQDSNGYYYYCVSPTNL